MEEEYGDAQQFQGADTQQGDTASVADALGHAHTDAQTGVTARAFTHGHGIERYGMTLSKGQGFIDKDTA